MRTPQRGFSLITTMFLLATLAALLAAYSNVSRIEMGTFRGMRSSANGFNVGEAGLNLRAETIRATFVGFNRPTGTSPTATNPCVGFNQGSGGFACQTNTFGTRTVTSYVVENPYNVSPYPVFKPIDPGERYQGLNAQEYEYAAYATARNAQSKVEAQLELRFKSRLVPLFQFAAFYNKDLEILPGPSMVLSGPVHTNGDLYLNGDTSLDISGQVTTAGNLYRGRKNQNSCMSRPIRVFDPITARSLIPSCSTRRLVTTADVALWNNMIQMSVPAVSVPAPEELDALPDKTYFSKADLRLVMRLSNAHVPLAIEVRDTSNVNDATATAALAACTGTVTGTFGANRAVNAVTTFRDRRENRNMTLLDVDIRNLLDCLHNNRVTIWGGKQLNDTTEGGLVFHFSLSGPDSSSAGSRYGVRLRNAGQLRPTVAGAPNPVGMTVVTDGAIYVMGDYNATNKIPAAGLADTFNVLSNNWNDANSNSAVSARVPTNTTQQLAVLAATGTTGNVEGAGGQGGTYNGGLENYPRFHENWNGTVTYTYRGSFVSLNRPRRSNGAWVFGDPVYTAPIRNWNYDTSFNTAQNLPPITPRFVYLKQQLFVRDYEQ
jgi:hypothetical protein